MSSESQYEVVWTPAPAVDAEADLPPRYELVRDVGDGLLGPVFGVRDVEDGRRWARLEVVSARMTIDVERAARLENAWRNAKRIVSAHVARVRDLGRLEDGRWFVVSEWIDGETLRVRLKRDGHLHVRHALEVARQTLLGLESAHAHDLAHGALDVDNVWLANGAPKTDLDPHGTSVRLTDFGVAVSIDPSTPRTNVGVRADLSAVAQLLDAMVAPGATDSLSTAARELSSRVRHDAESFTTALALREAVEALLRRAGEAAASARQVAEPSPSPAPRVREPREQAPPRAARWAVPTVAVLGLGALGLLVWGLSERREVEARDVTLVEERTRAQALTTELAAASASAAAEAAAKAELEARALAAQNEARAALAAEAERARIAQAEAADLRSAREAAERELEAARKRTEDAERAARAAEIEIQPKTRVARSFDAALAGGANGSWADVSRRLAALEVEGAPSSDFCRELASVADGLDRWSRSKSNSSADSEDLRAAEAALARAEVARASLPSQAAEWFDHDGAAVERDRRVEAVLTSVRAEFAREKAALAEADSEDWRTLIASTGVQDPTEAFAHARRFGCEHLSELGARFASELRSWVIVDDALDVPLLQSFHQLRDWLERIRAGQVNLPEKVVQDLELAEFAQRWHDLDFGNDAGLDWKRFEFPKLSSARREWKNELVLKWRLGQPDSGYPARAGGLSLYRCVDAEGRVEFWRETPLSVSSASWRLRRERLAEDGATNVGEGVLRIDRNGSRFDLAGSNMSLLDLRDIGESVLVTGFPPTWDGELPAPLAQTSELREAFRAQRSACLVTNNGDVRRWFHPRWGLVREESRGERGWFTRELVFAR
jgi:hypothetical protein